MGNNSIPTDKLTKIKHRLQSIPKDKDEYMDNKSVPTDKDEHMGNKSVPTDKQALIF